MNAYERMAKSLEQVAEGIKSGEIAFTEIPFKNITEIIQYIYDQKTGDGATYTDLYGILLIKGLEHKDAEEVATVLQLLAKHIVITMNDSRGLKAKQCHIAHLLNNEKIRKWYEKNGDNGKVPFNGKGVIYSANIGNYDQVKEPQYVNPDLDYILFTDNPETTSSVWQVRLVENKEQLDNVRLARRIKILGHEYLPEYDYSIWVDSKLEIIGNLREYVEKYRRKEPILCFNHLHDCIYQEAALCCALKKDSLDIIERQMQKYRAEGYPENNGLVETGILVRELKNERLLQLMETWWQEIVNESRRDQLSFNYACWKNDFVYDTTDLYIYGNEYVELYNHN